MRLTVLVALSFAATVGAQTPSGQKTEELEIPRSSDPGKQPFIRKFVGDEIEMWTSPFRKSSYTGRAATKYVLPFTLIAGTLIATDRNTVHHLPNSEGQSRWSLRVSQIGAPYSLAGMAATMYLASRATGNKKARETGFLGAEAIGHAQIFTQVIKVSTRRMRPFRYEEEGIGGTAFWRGGDSFPSGHASSSFALATVFAYEYGRDHHWVPFASYGVATGIAMSRVSARRHWPSDIFVGSSMGFMIGRFVYKHHHDPRVDGENARHAHSFVPEMGVGPKGLTLEWHL